MKNVTGSFACALGLLAAIATPGAAQDTASSPAVPPSSTAAPAPASPAGPVSTIVERVLVRVNGEILTQSQLTTLQIEALREREQPPSGAEVEPAIAEITPALLVAAVDNLLLVQHGRELGLTFTQEQFQQAIENIKKANKLDDAALANVLAQDGLTLEDIRQRLEQQYFIQGVEQREIGPSMTITLEEQRQYYKRNSEQFMTPLTITIRELLVTVPTRTQGGQEVFSAADDEAAKAKITGLRDRAVAGEDFTAMISANSDSATKSSGGLIGPVNVEDLSPALKDMFAKLEPGQFSEPIRTTRGYQVFELEERATPQMRPFDEVRREIETAIRMERLEPEKQKLLARLRTQAVVEWKDDSLRQIYERQIAATTAQP